MLDVVRAIAGADPARVAEVCAPGTDPVAILEILRPYRHLRAPEPNEDWMLGAHRWENGEYEVHAALMERGARGDAVLTVIVGADGARLEDAHT